MKKSADRVWVRHKEKDYCPQQNDLVKSVLKFFQFLLRFLYQIISVFSSKIYLYCLVKFYFFVNIGNFP